MGKTIIYGFIMNNNFEDREPLFINGKCFPRSEYDQKECDSINRHIAIEAQQESAAIYIQEPSPTQNVIPDTYPDSYDPQFAGRHFGGFSES